MQNNNPQLFAMKLPDGRVVEVRGRPSDTGPAFRYMEEEYPDWEEMNDEELRSLYQGVLFKYISLPVADDFIKRNGAGEYDWAVPGMFEYGDRFILTGGEGKGKSTLIRQWLVQISCGIHPLTLKSIDPVPTLLVDLENPPTQLSRELGKLKTAAGKAWGTAPFRVESHSEGWDLLDKDNQKRLRDLVKMSGAVVVGIGPLYRMLGGEDEKLDGPANALSGFLSELSEECAILIEAHVPHPGPGNQIITRPIGSSVWKRWPNFGMYLNGDTGALKPWRGGRDESREWPAALKRNGKWPWTALTEEASEDVRWRKLRAWWIKNNRKPTSREAAAILDVSQPTASRLIRDHTAEWPVPADSSDSR